MQNAPPGFDQQEVQRHQKRVEEIAAASATPLPGPLLDAIEPRAKKVCGFTLRPIVLSDIAFLQRIDSPLIKIGEIAAKTEGNGSGTVGSLMDKLIEAMNKPGSSESKTQAMGRLSEGIIHSFFILATPTKRVRSLIAAGKLEETAMEEIGDKLKPGDLVEIQNALAQHFSEAYSTVVGYTADTPQDGSFQLPPARKATE